MGKVSIRGWRLDLDEAGGFMQITHHRGGLGLSANVQGQPQL